MSRALNYSKAFPSRKDPDGKPLCRQPDCSIVLSGRRTSFCSDSCRDKALILCWPTEQRAQVKRRDKEICAGCGLDCAAALQHCRDAIGCFAEVPAVWARGGIHRATGIDAVAHFLGIRLGNRRTLWEANHIVPVIEGGTSSLDNLETLCLWCHNAHTKAVKGRLAKSRRRQMELV